MRQNEVVHLFTMMNPDNRIFFWKFKEPSFINQRLIGLNFINPEQDYELCHALLNTVLMKFFIEAIGFGRGLGVLDINKKNVENCYILNPALLKPTKAKEIKEKFAVICRKKIVAVEKELIDADWISFNKTVLDAFGIGAYYTQICNSLTSLRQVRYAATEKFQIADNDITNTEYPSIDTCTDYYRPWQRNREYGNCLNPVLCVVVTSLFHYPCEASSMC